MRGRIAGVFLIAASAASVVLAVESSPARYREPPAADAGSGTDAAVLTPRRAPEFLRLAIAGARLTAGLDALLGSNDAPAAGACLMVSHRNQTVYARAPRAPLIPASTQKVLTATAALERLGPAASFRTDVRARTAPANGVVDGPVWLVGGGDPLLSTADYVATLKNQPQTFTDLSVLADRVAEAGVREIRGGVIGDESRYDTQRYVPTWKAGYITDSEVGPASSLVVNDGFVQFVGRKIAATSPPQHAAATLAGLLRDRGVAVAGPVSTGAAPDEAVRVASISSAPLTDVVAEMLAESDNLTAELLVKELGHRDGPAGSTAAGVEEVEESLASAGVPTGRITLVDGSGLDRGNRATCAALMAAVEESGPDGVVARGFAVANRTGTLARRFVDHPAAGRLRAKTGALDGVTGLTGFVDGVPGGPLAFALISNQVASEPAGRRLQEDVGAVLATFPDAPPSRELAP